MSGDRVFLTGASGFVGSHIARELLARGYRVRALYRPGSGEPMDGVEPVAGDLEHPGTFDRALYGCRFLVHCAALYSFTPHDRARMHAVNVVGTAGLLEAARIAGIERAVVTSSSAALGPANGHPRTEEDWAHDEHASGYHHSKLEQERAAVAARIPVVRLLPTAPVGPGDWKPTPTGRMILDFARGKMAVLPPRGGLNLVPVEDVARAHVIAMERGRAGERYILGGENLTLDQVWEMLAAITGKPMPKMRIPAPLLYALAYGDELRCRMIPGSQPEIPLEGVRMSQDLMFADSSKAARELDFAPGPVQAALERAVEWYRANGYVQ